MKEPGTLTLIGSGEMADSMAKTHRFLMARLQEPVRAVFVDTPAGFEVNVDEIGAKAVEYFGQRLQVPLTIASFKSASLTAPDQVTYAAREIERANYIFAGPGSPTYAVRQWRNSQVWQAMVQRLEEGAAVVLASAAAISISRFALPVYEIYKAGQDPAWQAGLNLLAPYGLDLAVVPHWNNAEGQYDTRFCFMGAVRLAALEHALPNSTVIVGIDEYTACVLDLAQDQAQVMGAGQVIVRRGEQVKTFTAGTSFALDELRQSTAPVVRSSLERDGGSQSGAPLNVQDAARALAQQITRARGAFASTDSVWSIADAASSLCELAEAFDRARQAGVDKAQIEEARRVIRELGLEFGERAVDDGMMLANVGPFLDLLVNLRSRLRAARQFQLADQVREQLTRLGVVLEDTPDGTHWRKTNDTR